MNNNNNNNRFPASNSGGLIRYDSAPGSLLNAAVDSVINEYSTSHFFPTSSAENSEPMRPNLNDNADAGLHHRSYAFPTAAANSSSSLVRHSSSPAGFLNQLASAASSSDINAGFSITNGIGIGSYNAKDNGRGLNSQLSFTRKEALSRISEENENGFMNDQRKSNSNSYGFGMGSWDDTNNPIIFSMASNKRSKTNTNSNDVDHTNMESQFEFSMAQTLEMDAMDKLLHNIPQDSVPCKIRAKRGFATHPRSIAERERRTRISGKLKKLQDLVPNMDKQTSYSDMLDLAVQHIKTLQNQVQKLNKEVDNCTCGCSKNNTDS